MMWLTQWTRQRMTEYHTGNNSVDKRKRGTTTRMVHDNVPPVCGPRGGDSERRQVGCELTTPWRRGHTRRPVCVRAVNRQARTESGAAQHEDRRKQTRRNKLQIAAKDNALANVQVRIYLICITFNFLILTHPHALILLPTQVSTRLNRKSTGNTAPLILHLSPQPGKVGNLIAKNVFGLGLFLYNWWFIQVDKLCCGLVGRPLFKAFQPFLGRCCLCSATKQKRWSRCIYVQTEKNEIHRWPVNYNNGGVIGC